MRIPMLSVLMLLASPLYVAAAEPIGAAIREEVAAIGRVTAISSHPKGHIAIGMAPGHVLVMTADQVIARRFDGEATIQSGMPRLNALAWSPDGRRLAIGGGQPAESGSVEIFESLPSGWRCTHRSTLHDDVVTGLAWSPDSKWLATAGHDGIACVLQLPSEVAADGGPATDNRSPANVTANIQVRGHSRGLACAAWIADDQLVTGSLDHTLRVWDLAPAMKHDGSEAEPFDGKPQASARGTQVEASGASLAAPSTTRSPAPAAAAQTGGESGSEWGPELLRTLKNHTSEVSAIAVRPTVEMPLPVESVSNETPRELVVLVSVGQDRTVRFWQPQIGRMMRFVRLPAAPLAVDWHPDRQQVVVGTNDGQLHVVAFDTAEVVRSVSVMNGPVWAVAVIAEGRHVVAGGPAGVTVIALVD